MKLIVFLAFVLGVLVKDTCLAQSAKINKPTMAVMDFKSTQGIDQNEAVTLSNKFRSSLGKTQAYTVLERSAMETILKEQDVSLTDLCDNTECAVEVGRLLVAEKMIIGEVGKIGSTYSITVRIVDVSTGKIEKTEDQQYKGSSEDLFAVFDEMAQKLTGVYRRDRTWWYVGGAAVLGGVGSALLLQGKSGGADKRNVGLPPAFPKH